MLPPLNVSHQSSTCLILELGLHFKLFDFVEFLRLFFSPLARKIIFEKIQLNQKISLHSNQAGAALVRHIKWWQHCFFRCLNLASQKDGAFDILSSSGGYLFKHAQRFFDSKFIKQFVAKFVKQFVPKFVQALMGL